MDRWPRHTKQLAIHGPSRLDLVVLAAHAGAVWRGAIGAAYLNQCMPAARAWFEGNKRLLTQHGERHLLPSSQKLYEKALPVLYGSGPLSV